MNPATQPIPPSTDRTLKVRVVEELFITVEPEAPAAWNPKTQRDGAISVVGLLRVQPEGTSGALPLSLISQLDRSPILEDLAAPKLIGMCEGAGMVFEGAESLYGVPRRWIIFPMEAPGLVVA